MDIFCRFADILASDPTDADLGLEIGRSRGGREIRVHRFGKGPTRVSLVAGSHADEPVGPGLLRHLVSFLLALRPHDPMLARYEWWIVPNVNPDGAARNRAWTDGVTAAYDVGRYLANVVRELPGDDIEFGYPRDAGDLEVRPENRSVWDWWRSAGGSFHLHASLHGMSFGAGPWHLVEEAWADRSVIVIERCRAATRRLGYVLHDVERRGEKGFFRIERGFCTRPDSRRMREHFLALGDPDTAARFRPSSMEVMRALGGDALTLVSEMPLFLTPGVGEHIGPPDPMLDMWRDRITAWKARLAGGTEPAEVSAEAAAVGLEPMPIRDQMELQWRLITAGIELVESGGTC